MKLWTAALYLLARREVSKATRSSPNIDGNECEDILPSSLVPSVARNDRRDRVLAEIDQDGFLFAVEDCDIEFFNTRDTMAPRKHHRVQIVLTDGFVRLRKSVLRHRTPGILAHIRDSIQWDLYLEAAALLRLRGVAGIPSIRRFDPSQGLIEMDYIWGRDLGHIFADGRRGLDYEEVSRQFAARMAKPDDELSDEITRLLIGVIGRGVIPRDIHPANFIRARSSQTLYMVDFNLIYLRPVPGWRSYARNLDSILETRPEAAGIFNQSWRSRQQAGPIP